MDKTKIDKELDTVFDNLDCEDERSKEYAQMVVVATKLQSLKINEEELETKKSRSKFDEDMRKEAFEFEKKKARTELKQRELDRELESRKIEHQHQEKMAEIHINQIKAENEKIILEQNQERANKEFKANRRRDWLMFGGKAFMLLTVIGINVIMHKDELRFEREEHGIVPQRCKVYDAVVNKATDIVMK